MLTRLLALLNTGSIVKTLPQILDTLTNGGNLRQALRQVLSKKVDAQAGRSAGQVLGRTVCEAIDAAMEAKADEVPVETSIEAGKALAANAALQLSQAAEIILAYGPLQEAVVRAKASDDKAALAGARSRRDEATNRVKDALTDVARVCIGQAPEDK